MIKVIEKKELTERANPRIQRFAYDLFSYLSTKPKISNEQARLNHAVEFNNNMHEFMGMLKVYVENYRDSIISDERRDKTDYNSIIIDRVYNGLKSYFKYNFYQR